MIRDAYLVRFDRLTENGRTAPLRVAVETSDQVEHDVVLKVSSGRECSVEGLANETLGSLLAADLNLPVTEPFLVQIEPAFVDSVQDSTVQHRLREASPVAFGSKHAGKQWRRWGAHDKIPISNSELALSIIAFDAFVANNDRSPRNSNMLVKDDEWRLIDHESAFSFRMKLFPPCRPWETGKLELLKRYGEDSEHVFTRQLAGRSNLDFTAVRSNWKGLSDARLSQYEALIPEEWSEIGHIFADAVRHLKQVRDRIDDCIAELRRVLS